MGSPHRPVAGDRIKRAEWVKRAVQLSIKGWSSRRIGEKVGRHWTTVAEALAKEFERARPSVEEVEAARELHREKLLRREGRLNALLLAHWPTAKGGDVDASKVVIDADKGLDRVHASLAKLDGLDAPTKSEVTGKDGGPLAGAATPENAAALVREMFGDKASKSSHGDRIEDDAPEVPREVPERPSPE